MRILQARRLGEDQVTLDALGHKLGISKERVRQIESRALEKLKKALIETGPADDRLNDRRKAAACLRHNSAS